MGTFGNEFWNVLALDREQMMGLSTVPMPLDDARVQLNAICRAASDRHSSGVIVYLPPREYIISAKPGRANRRLETAWNDPDLWLLPNVTLWFAPGARLVIRRDAVVRIDGPLRAEPTWIFQCVGNDSASERRGRALLYSTKVAEVYPEWWGAVSYPDDHIFRAPTIDDTDALVDCLHAAHIDRAFPGNLMPTIPVVLRGKYFVSREIEVKAHGPTLADGAPDRTLTFEDRVQDPMTMAYTHTNYNAAGIVLIGRRGASGSDAGFSTLEAMGPIPITGTDEQIEAMPTGRAILRIDGLHGSVIDGVAFNGNGRASVCMQITGNNARSTTFRGCSFVRARHILAQVGDYIILDRSMRINGSLRMNFHPLSSRRETFSHGGYDLSGLRFENCRFESGIPIPDIPTGAPDSPAVVAAIARRIVVSDDARKVTGVVFHAGNTLPMTLDNCFFIGGMAAGVAAYGGTMIVRGGGSQNTTAAEDRLPIDNDPGFQKPRGGVDFFIGDPILKPISPVATEAASPTGLTVIQFESQSEQFLDTFSHLSASANRVAFYPTVLQGVSQRSTVNNTLAPPSVIWLGPGMTVMGDTEVASRASTLSLVGCVWGGRRLNGVDNRTDARTASLPTGAVVVDWPGFLVADVGTRVTNPAPAVFYTRAAGGSITQTPLDLARRPVWLRSL